MIAAAADKACEVIGAGSLAAHTGCISYGTTATITNTQTRYVEPIPLIPPYPAAVPNAYSLEVQIYRGFWMVSWFKKEFGQLELQMAQEQGIAAEVLLDQLVAEVPAGSMGLVLQPYWSPGLKVPGPEAKGAVIGFGDVHTRAHLYRAMIGRAGLRAARGQGAAGAAHRHADHRTARVRRRFAERRRHAIDRRHLWPAGHSPACL